MCLGFETLGPGNFESQARLGGVGDDRVGGSKKGLVLKKMKMKRGFDLVP